MGSSGTILINVVLGGFVRFVLTSGFDIPFETRCLALTAPTGLLPTVEVTIQADDGEDLPSQRLLLDAGSSSLSLCDASLQVKLTDRKTNLHQCGRYAGGSAYDGSVYQGPLRIGDSPMFQANYTLMEVQETMPCKGGFQGIIGIAKSSLNMATPLPLPRDITLPCPAQNISMPSVADAARVSMVGIHWSVTDTQLITDEVTKGVLSVNAPLGSNAKFDDGAALKARLNTTSGFYGINITKITSILPSGETRALTAQEGWFDCSNGNCIFDTGNTKITMPMSARAQLFDCAAPSNSCANKGSISFELEGTDSSSVTLSFNATELQKTWPVCSDHYPQLWDGGVPEAVAFGMPFWAAYHTEFDIENQEVTIMPKQSPRSQALLV